MIYTIYSYNFQVFQYGKVTLTVTPLQWWVHNTPWVGSDSTHIYSLEIAHQLNASFPQVKSKKKRLCQLEQFPSQSGHLGKDAMAASKPSGEEEEILQREKTGRFYTQSIRLSKPSDGRHNHLAALCSSRERNRPTHQGSRSVLIIS